MKVLLVKDVYKLGRAGDIKKVADGYGRNFLLPNRLGVLATAGALKQADTIRASANSARDALNTEMGSVSEKINGMVLPFTMKAGETGKLYGSITTQMIADAIEQKSGLKVDRHQIDLQPIRVLGEHKASVRLTVDLTPQITVMVHREGEAVLENAKPAAKEAAPEAAVEPAAAAEPEATPAVEPDVKAE
jgi:large subunit ribosomal protein L9